jgi:hypothetical protein
LAFLTNADKERLSINMIQVTSRRTLISSKIDQINTNILKFM